MSMLKTTELDTLFIFFSELDTLNGWIIWYLLEKEMSTHFSILALQIPLSGEPGRLYSPWGCKELAAIEPISGI